MKAMTLSEELQWRGFVQDSTFKDLSELDKQTWTFYIGFDASAPSQTIGNLASIMACRVFLRHGHQAIILAGGATSLIGDPGGKDKERVLQDEQTIAANVDKARTQLEFILQDHEFKLVNNLDWLGQMKVIPYLRDIGKHFSMTPLVQRDYVAQRLGEQGAGMSYTEFSYTLLQGLDYLHLFDNYGCRLQVGGSDQWGNCLSGVELIRRARGQAVQALTLPLIIDKSTGRKFGKSEAGAVWLDPQATSPYNFYQFWFNSGDESVADYLKIFTDLDKPALETIVQEQQVKPSQRVAQKRLAAEVTKLVHGGQALATAAAVTAFVFGEAQALTASVKETVLSELPTHRLSDLKTVDLSQALVELNLASSKSQAKQLLESGAIRSRSGEKLTTETDLSSYLEEDLVILRRGKNRLGVIQIGA